MVIKSQISQLILLRTKLAMVMPSIGTQTASKNKKKVLQADKNLDKVLPDF